jgi:hypothetical protein
LVAVVVLLKLTSRWRLLAQLYLLRLVALAAMVLAAQTAGVKQSLAMAAGVAIQVFLPIIQHRKQML